MSKRRVVVTGLGIVSPVGSDIATAWSAILAGKSGIKPITRIDVTPFATKFAGEVEGFDVATYVSPKSSDIFIYVLLLMILMVRPWGLFGQRELGRV